MKKALFVSAALTIAGLSGAAGAAGAETYDCRFAPGDSDNGWIMPRVVITHDPATGKAQVLDNIVAFHNDGQPMAAKFKAGSNGVMKFSWRVTNVSTSTP
ncbi:MAG: hypothetical protein OIF47_11815, partial [Marinibacterium sp.]|nr:hypothetical protein [Marinibacterium sp.]